ncbi:activating transcription factor 7-interacting protein 1 isoform X2 [Betta splendens]|uniref:Activating transcription factor 7-interacting protein 1 isoform X2 n=1 Tax=Betta splendens TaxID=158456 RepID=A0A6P7LW75_BETSP|nr:activating transcription factor 7-interacting protein 1 isoform X2 [Betta splendens]XP_055364539.1 activating transcription factor 7-interacting protein 1 isoform X2 [Betta splendens]
MEVVVTEEKKKIFRAKKTMKISDRQQLESLHSTLLTTAPVSSQSPKEKEETPNSPSSPFHSLNFELKKMEEEKKDSSSSSSNESIPPSVLPDKNQEFGTDAISEKENKEDGQTAKVDQAADSAKGSVKGVVPRLPAPPPVTDFTEPVDINSDTTKAKDTEASTAIIIDEKPSTPKTITSDSSSPCSSSSTSDSSSCAGLSQEKEIKDEEKDDKDLKKGLLREEKMDVDFVKVETKKEKNSVGQTMKLSRPSSTPPSNAVQEEKGSTSGIKRTLSEGFEKEQTVRREGKRPKMEREELEAQLELKITAKAGGHHKLGKIVQQLVDEQLRILELTIFDKHFQELKDRVDKIDCATKHQTAINTLQAKIARLSKKFGEANQMSENKRKQEALAAAAAAAAAKAASAATPPQAQRPVRTSLEVKQTPTTTSPSNTASNPAQPAPAPAATPASVPTTTSTAMVPPPILQLITSTPNAASTLATGITTQSPTGTLLLKTAPGSSMMATGQPLLIQLPISMANGQAGTLVNIPVSLSAASSLNKAKTTATTTTFILKPASTTTAAPVSSPASAPAAATTTLPALQASTSQATSAQISVARAVYPGGAGAITTPNAGISVTTARTPAQSVSVAGAMSSTSSPATSGPAATGSTAPGPPQGTSLTSKTDNQSTGSNSSKSAASAARPKGSVIDLTEDDDDVQVTGVKNASPSTQRSHPVVTIPNSTGARSSPQSNSTSSSNPQLTIHHRPPLESTMKSRPAAPAASARGSSVVLPPLPAAPVIPRLPPEAERSSPPQQPQLKLVPSQTGIVLSWCVVETDRTCAPVDSYHLYAFHQDNANSNAAQQHWKKIGEVKALPLPMACTLTQFQSGSTYHFAVRAKDIYGRFGSFCEPQCTNVINSNAN